ncbi:MAG: transglycosylase SLT domain-containing protein [Acidobacteriales bacterium]|nr:transglycosylase SLT domain-containing protein [Terriglobales bacterium]
MSAPPSLPPASAPQTASAHQDAPQQSKPAASPSLTATQVSAAENVDPVNELISNVEKEYELGEAQQKLGNTAGAKPHFDRALSLLLDSPIDIQSDSRVQAEFERVRGAMQTDTPQPADATIAQKSEPAPIDEANGVNFPVDPNIKAKAEAEVRATHSDLPLMLTDPVVSYINYFSTRGRGTLERALIRSGRYREMIGRTLKQEGVPQDLIYLAQAESGFHPQAVSRAGARGIWQFMPSRAKAYGLRRDLWLDERQDPEKSTHAAARHLKDLYNQFGDWYLAMAAYNSGPGTVQAAVKRTGYADFWELYRRDVLPKETRNYVPIIVAVTIMAKNPAQYGLEGMVTDHPVPYDTVKIDYPVDLRLVAECTDTSTGTLLDLNPSLLRFGIPKGESFELHLPQGTAEKYQSAVANIPSDQRMWWRYHEVAPNETLTSIAHSYRVLPRSIAEVNGLADGEQLPLGQRLIVPIAPGSRDISDRVQSYARHATPHKVLRGETVDSVADNFGVSATMLRRWNHLKGNSLQGRRVVYVHIPVTPGTADSTSAGSTKRKAKSKLQPVHETQSLRHRVKSGETLYSIATTYNTTVAKIQQQNRHLATLRPGMILIIPPAR